MGASSSNPPQNASTSNSPTPSTFLNLPTIISHQRLKNFKYIKGLDEDTNIFVAYKLENEGEYDKWQLELRSFKLDLQYYLMPLEIRKRVEGACGGTVFADVKYECFPHVLGEEIRNRAMIGNKNSMFKECQVWYLVFTLVSAARNMHVKGIKIGDVRPQNILINGEGQIKCTTLLSFPKQSENYQKTLICQQQTYLSPQQLKQARLNKQIPQCNPTLAQSFSVGLVCLEAASLKNNITLYLKDKLFDSAQLEKRIDLIRDYYSDDLCQLIQKMCSIQPRNRLNCVQVYEMLNKHKQQILEMVDFKLNQQPSREIASDDDESRSIQNSRTKPVQLSDTRYQTASKTNNNTPIKANQKRNVFQQMNKQQEQRQREKERERQEQRQMQRRREKQKQRNINNINSYVKTEKNSSYFKSDLERRQENNMPSSGLYRNSGLAYDKNYKYQPKQSYPNKLRQTYEFKSYESPPSPYKPSQNPQISHPYLSSTPYRSSMYQSPTNRADLTRKTAGDSSAQYKYQYKYGPSVSKSTREEVDRVKEYDYKGQKKQFTMDEIDRKIQQSRKLYV